MNEAAGYIGCRPQTLRRWVQKEKISFLRDGWSILFHKAELDRFIGEQLEVEI